MPRPPRRARRAPAQPAKPSTTVEAEPVSDNDDSLQDSPPVRGRKRTTRSAANRLSLADERAIHAAEKSRDAALDRLADEDPTSTSGNAVEDEDSPASIELGRRVPSPPAQRRDTTGLDLADDDVFGDLVDSFERDDEPQGTRSTDVSSLNLSNFKRRPRSSSIIGRNDPPIRPSSRSGTTPNISSTLNLGVFRRRAREPSILGTARKPRPEETITLSSDPESSDEEDFAPDAESTPLDKRRRTRPASESEFDSDTLQDITSKSKSRKRKSDEGALGSDRPEKISRVESGEDDEEVEEEDEEQEERAEKEIPVEEIQSDSESSLSSLSSPSGPTPVLPDRPVTPFQDEEIMAPPASSGSEDDHLPDIHGLAKRRRRPSVTTPARGDNFSDISSPPSLTHSPNYEDTRKTRGRAAARRQPSPKVTTADLTNMLPKRRYKKTRDPFDLESEEELDASGLGQDEDELSYLDTRTARRRKGSRPPSRGGAARPGSRGGRSAQTALKPRQTPASARPTRNNNKTYSRRSSDKENEEEDDENHSSDEEHERSRFRPLPEDSFDSAANESSSTPSADELRKAAKKFKEVDRWELEFEEITQSSSPPDAR